MSNKEYGFEDYGDMQSYFDRCDDPSDVWDGRISKKVQRHQYTEWLAESSDWKVFVTLTFRNQLYIDYLITALNRDLFGKHYERIVGDSYFSYICAAELQLRGDIHFHMLADRPLNFRTIHELWNEWAGFALTEVIRDPSRAVRYVVKYVVKNDNLIIFKSAWKGEPMIYPDWWTNYLSYVPPENCD